MYLMHLFWKMPYDAEWLALKISLPPNHVRRSLLALQKKPRPLGIRLTSLVKDTLSCPYKQAARLTEPWRSERSQCRRTEERVNIFCLLGEQSPSSFFCRGNRVYIVTVVCEENAMICFDSSPNVPVKCECACLIASCAKHSTECIVFK